MDLTTANPTEAFSDYPHAEISHYYAAIPDFTYRPEPLGLREAREAISQWYKSRGVTISPDQLALTASTSEAYSLLFKLLCDPGEEVLIPTPSYPLFEYLAAAEAVRTVPYRLAYDGSWFIDFESLRQAIGPQARAIVIVNPNNPTGSFLKQTELRHLFAIASERHLAIISDEVFMDYGWNADPKRVPTLIGQDEVLSFSLNGLSKSAGMPQMKLGWLAVNGPTVERQQALERLELLLDTFLSVGTPVQNALPGLFEAGTTIREKICQRIQANNEALDQLLANAPIHRLHGEGGWSAILQLPNIMGEEAWISRLLKEQGVVVQPGYFFDMPTEPFVVVSLITELADFADGISKLKDLVEQSTGGPK